MLQRMQRAHGHEGSCLNEEVLLNGLFSSRDATITFKSSTGLTDRYRAAC